MIRLYNLLKYSILETLRIPLVIFFNNLFPIVMLLIFMSLYGNGSIGGGLKLIDKYYFILLPVGIAPLTLVSLPMNISIFINSGIMETYVLYGIKAKTKLVADLLSHLIISCIQLIIITAIAYMFYSLRIPKIQYFIFFVLQYVVVLIAMSFLGVCLALLLRKSAEVQAVAFVLMFVVLFLSGTFGDINEGSSVLGYASKMLPTHYLTSDLFSVWKEGIFFSKGLLISSLTYIVVFGVSALFLADKRLDKPLNVNKINN